MAKLPAQKTDVEEVASLPESPAADPAPAPASDPAPAPIPEPEPDVRISVGEFCTRALDSDPRAYAGLYAFQRREENAGRDLDTKGNFEKRYKAMMESHPEH